MSVYWLEKDKLFSAALKSFEPSSIVLDIGCGINPQKYVRPLVHICCEPFGQYIENLQEKIKNEYDRSYIIVKATWAEAVRLFPPKSVDTVFLIDVIEHIEKEEAFRLLKVTETLAKKQIAVFTPLGFFPQAHSGEKDAWGLEGGVWQEHKSGWQPEDFDDSWDVFASRVFHTIDNLGRKLEEPYGALWAVKNLGGVEGENREILLKKEKIRTVVDMAIDIGLDTHLSLFIFIMRMVLKIMTSKPGGLIIRLLIRLLKR